MTDILKIKHSRTLPLVFAAALALVACEQGDDYNEYGQLVEKTDVRVKGVTFGRAVDEAGRITEETDTFGSGDTVYAAVRTKGSSRQTVLGVRWHNPAGEEIGMENTVIRPTGDTVTVFANHYLANRGGGHFSLDLCVNGKVVKTAHFTMSGTPLPASPTAAVAAAPRDESRTSSIVDATSRFFASAKTSVRSGFAWARSGVQSRYQRATFKVGVMTGREPKDQSPFEWHGLRAGMRLSKLDHLSEPGAAWKRQPFMFNVIGLQRATAVQNDKLGAGDLQVIADTTADRVLEVQYAPAWIPTDSSNRLAFEREMIALGDEWDKIPGVIRQQTGQTTGPYFFEWATPDSTWRGTIHYYGSAKRAGRPSSVSISELHWDQRVFTPIIDSLKRIGRNPGAAYSPGPPGN